MSRADDLIDGLRRQYDTGSRRTVNAMLLRDAVSAVEQLERMHAVVLEQRATAAQENLDLQNRVLTKTHALEVERLEILLESARRTTSHQEETIRTLEERLRNVKQTATATDDGIEVSFAAPLSQHGHPRDWTVGELEDICYRLRTAGADDITKVDVSHNHTTAIVAFPELALEGLPTRRDDAEPEPTKGRRLPWWTPYAAAVTAGVSWTVVLVQLLR